jgi:flagellar FliJ protein
MSHQLPWNLLIDSAQAALDDATLALARAQQRALDAQAQLDVLATYRTEYLSRLTDASETGLSISALDNQRRFLDRLDQAVAQQRETLRQAQHHVSHCQSLWQASQRKLKSFDTLAERQQANLRSAAARREQIAADETATQRFLALARGC